ncbi:MAG: ABC transporter permease [Clostridiales bacterium]|nr:ABC transporter permease [Clostridiales bacterium]
MRATTFTGLIGQGAKGIWKNRMMSFASFCIMLVSLLLVGLTLLLSINLSRIVDSLESKNEIVVIINDGTTQEEITSLGKSIESLANIEACNFFSRDEAWKSMVENMSGDQKDLFPYDEENPLPDTYRVQIQDLESLNTTSVQISAFPNVEKVKSPNEYAEIFINIRNILTLVSAAIVITLVIVCLIIISNTTRASVFSRRKEINIMRYVGATNSFIRIPFFIEGMLVGVLAGLASLGLTKFVYESIYNLVTSNSVKIFSTIGLTSIYSFGDISKYLTLAYILSGAIIGALGTTISTRKYCKV